MTTSNNLSRLSGGNLRFLSVPRLMLIGDRWVGAASGDTMPVFDPSSGREFARVPSAGVADVDAAVAAAKRAFETGPWRSLQPADRERLLWRLADLIECNAGDLAQLEALDNGKAVTVASGVDVPLTIRHLRYMAGFATKIHGRTIATSVPYMPGAEFFSYTVREPIGVVGQIIPWNMPLMFSAWKLGAALAAGCTVVLKPASNTPLTALRLGELILEAGFPPGVVNLITGPGGVVGERLARHPDIDKIAFTGSTEVGRKLGRICGDEIKPISLELGGKSPSIVLADARMEQTIPGVISGIFANSGQVCAAGSRLYVQRPLYEPLIAALNDAVQTLKLGPGLDPETFVGPLVSAEQKKIVCDYIASGVAEGARLVTGGGVDGEGYYVKPTILADAKQHMRVVREEIFGPVLTVAPFDDVDEAIALANDNEMGLAASVYSQDVSKIHRIVPRIRAGTVWVNCHNVYD
ncbi:MAG TPA: aldehyde dehydrogenase family protein, partial [Steroidobacter sp.]|nr:aldehyde dehydrogenase family protein [Steroidobacter sp.]